MVGATSSEDSVVFLQAKAFGEFPLYYYENYGERRPYKIFKCRSLILHGNDWSHIIRRPCSSPLIRIDASMREPKAVYEQAVRRVAVI